MVQIKHWQDAVNAILGIWLIASPWALGFSAETAPMANAVIVGIALIAAALGAIFVPRAWEEWTEAILGLWMIASPWLLGFAASRQAMGAAVITGIVILALALWTLATDKEYSAAWRRTAH
jgi:heme/copper-type cytochrome/quinol oxidase subunit 3